MADTDAATGAAAAPAPQAPGSPRLGHRAVVGYALGDFACNLSFTLATSYLLYYYTDVAGLSAGVLGTMFLVVRLVSAFADLAAGRIVDMTNTRWGRFRPFILFGSVPLLLLNVLTFHVPTGLGTGGKLAYAAGSYTLLGIAYSMVNIPYGSLSPAMTQDVGDRARLASARGMGTALCTLFIAVTIAPMVSAAKAGKADLDAAAYLASVQHVFTVATVGFMVVGVICFALTFAWTRETVVRPAQKVTLADAVAAVRHNRPLGYLCLAAFFYLIGMSTLFGGMAYFAQEVLGDTSYLVAMSMVSTVSQLAVVPFVPSLVRRFGKKQLFLGASVLTVVGGVGLFAVPVHPVALPLLFFALVGVGIVVANITMFGLEADTVEYGEWRTGQRSEGAVYAVFSFSRKLTQSLGGSVTAWALAAGGYLTATAADPDPVQPDSAVLAIRVVVALLPALVAAFAFLVFRRYPLDDSTFRRIRDENEARKAAAAAGGAAPAAS